MSHTNVVFLRNAKRHPVGVLAIHSTPDEPGVTVAASICAPADLDRVHMLQERLHWLNSQELDTTALAELTKRELVKAKSDSFDKETGIKLAVERLQDGGDGVVHSTTQVFEDAVSMGKPGEDILAQIALVAIMRSGAPLHKLADLEIALDANAVAACERYARKGCGRAR